MWPDTATPDNINTTITRLRHTIIDSAGEQFRHLITGTARRCQLDPDLITVDLWEFQNAIKNAQNLAAENQVSAYQAALDHYTEALADGINSYEIDAERQTIIRQALTTATHLADILIPTNPDAALHTLDQARTIDPYDEPTYRHIIRIQTQQNHADAAQRTYQLLTNELATLGAKPHPDTTALPQKQR